MPSSISRRRFLWTSGAAGLSLASLVRAQDASAAKVSPNSKLRVLSIGVIGTIGGVDLDQISSHPGVEIAGLCDVNANSLAEVAAKFPNAFTCKDYREAFSKHVDKFDAVIVATPDHSHAPIMISALAHNKHVYGQKPLVHQLEELVMMEKAIAARPNLVTQLGNQRMATAGRRAAVEILRQNMLGKAIEAHVWVKSPKDRDFFNFEAPLSPSQAPPSHLDWDLWLCACEKVPYRPGIEPALWRGWWNYGSCGLGDWGCHVLDVLFLAWPSLVSPVSVQTFCPPSPNPFLHAHPCQSTLTYSVDSQSFSRKQFVLHFSDSAQAPARASLGLPPGKYPDESMTVVVCEGGVLALTPNGRLEIWRDGKVSPGMKLPGLPDFPRTNHWHNWVDACLGKNVQPITPFKDAIRMTEATQLAVKSTRFPGEELYWDRTTLSFTNHEEATRTIVRRQYRDGFAPPTIA